MEVLAVAALRHQRRTCRPSRIHQSFRPSRGDPAAVPRRGHHRLRRSRQKQIMPKGWSRSQDRHGARVGRNRMEISGVH